MEFSTSKYFEMLASGDVEKAYRYMQGYLPTYIYKFISLDSNIGLNNSKLDTLKSDKIWVAASSEQNDPYEFSGIFLDKSMLCKKGFSDVVIDSANDLIKNSFCIAAFTSQMTDNLSMWAHYANNHRGFCIKYKVNVQNMFFKVFYEKERISISNTFVRFINACSEYESNHTPDNLKEIQSCSALLQSMYYIKHFSWNHENEIRLLYPNEKREKGFNVKNSECGIRIESIYTGYCCTTDHKASINSIAKDLGVECMECQLSDTKYTVFE